MVDYNIAIPQQQLFQAPDFTQNAMRMQQAQLQEMQMQALARENAEARNIQRLYAQPGFDQFSPEGIKQLGQAGGYKAGIAAANAARQIENLQRQTEATNAGLKRTYLDIGAAQYDIAQNRLAAIPPGDAKGYAEWDRVHGPAFRANGVNIPTPEQWAQDPTGKLQGHMVATSQSVRERAARPPVYRDVAGTTFRVDPDNPDVFIEPSIRRAGAPQQGAGTGPAMVPMSPSRAAEQRATQARLGETVTPFSTAGANVSVNNMPGVPVAPPVGAPVNNMTGAAAAPPPAVGNAMGRGPMPPAVQSSYGAPIGVGEFARQQAEDANQRNLQYEAQKAGAVKQAQTQAEKIEAKPKVQSSFVSAMAELQRQREAIADLKSRPWGTQFATGPIMGRLPNLAPFDITGAGAAQARIDQVKSSAGLTALQELKQSSPTGASGLGGTSDMEGRRLETSKAAVTQTQGTADFNQAVDTLDKDIESAQKRIMDAYVREYGELPPDIISQLPPPLVIKVPVKGKLENRAGALNVPSNVSVSGW